MARIDPVLRHDRAIGLDSNDKEAWKSKAHVLMGLGRAEQALRCYEHALSIDPYFEAAVEGRKQAEEELHRSQQLLQLVLTRGDLIGALSAQNTLQPVAGVMQREFQVADSSDMLEAAMERLQACACRTLPVVHDGRLVGLVTMDNIGEFVLIHAALTGKPAPRIPLSAEG